MDGDCLDAGDATFYAITDVQFSVVAMLTSTGKLHERVAYDSYGTARHHWKDDVDGDGDVDSSDKSAVTALLNKQIYQSGYNPAADIDRSGTIDSADASLVSSKVIAALPAGEISDRLSTGPDSNVGYDGYVFNPENLLYTVRFRHYDTGLGRWLERDPAGRVQGYSLYQYAASQSLRYLDPLGLAARSTCECKPPDDGMDDIRDAVKKRPNDPDHNAGWTEKEKRIQQEIADKTDKAAAELGEMACSIGMFLIPGPFDEVAVATVIAARGWKLVKSARRAIKVIDDAGNIVEPARVAAEARRLREAHAKARGLCGQYHHTISKKVHKALEEHPKLKGRFAFQDERCATQAKSLMDHKGYQTWHRQHDNDIADWLEKNKDADDDAFMKFLDEYYGKFKDKFPDGKCSPLPPCADAAKKATAAGAPGK